MTETHWHKTAVKGERATENPMEVTCPDCLLSLKSEDLAELSELDLRRFQLGEIRRLLGLHNDAPHLLVVKRLSDLYTGERPDLPRRYFAGDRDERERRRERPPHVTLERILEEQTKLAALAAATRTRTWVLWVCFFVLASLALWALR